MSTPLSEDGRFPQAQRHLPPWHWLRALLTRRLVLQRRGIRFHVVFADSVATSPPTEPGRGSALRCDHDALQRLFEQRPELRTTFGPLAYLEQTLATQGSRAFQSTSPKLLAKALQQVRHLSREMPDLHLPELERRLDDAVAASTVHTAKDFADAVQVSEASHSLFDELERSWTGQVPSPTKPN